MKVRVTLSLNVDPEAWDLAYGTGTDAAAVREDVKSYVVTYIQQSAAAEEDGITDVRVF